MASLLLRQVCANVRPPEALDALNAAHRESFAKLKEKQNKTKNKNRSQTCVYQVNFVLGAIVSSWGARAREIGARRRGSRKRRADG